MNYVSPRTLIRFLTTFVRLARTHLRGSALSLRSVPEQHALSRGEQVRGAPITDALNTYDEVYTMLNRTRAVLDALYAPHVDAIPTSGVKIGHARFNVLQKR